jgi:riboflavin synthase
MFTGIVTAVGTVARVERRDCIMRAAIESAYDPGTVEIGASIAHDGCCLTVVQHEPADGGARHFVDVAAESLARTKLGDWRRGDRVNLERSLRVGDELGGHFIQGHVDGVGEVLDVEVFEGAGQRVWFRAPADLMPLIAKKGSVVVDGVSLTVNDVREDAFEAMIIPHTLHATTLGDLKSGDKVNLEADMMARYAARLIEARRDS